MNLNKGGILTFEMVRQCIMGEEVATPNEETNKPQSFIGIWEEIISGLRTDDDGARFTTAESYECALKSLRKILGPNMIKGFCISAAEIQKWKDGMHNGVKDENGKIIGKSVILPQGYIYAVVVPYGISVYMKAISKMFLILSLTRRRKGL